MCINYIGLRSCFWFRNKNNWLYNCFCYWFRGFAFACCWFRHNVSKSAVAGCSITAGVVGDAYAVGGDASNVLP